VAQLTTAARWRVVLCSKGAWRVVLCSKGACTLDIRAAEHAASDNHIPVSCQSAASQLPVSCQ
jgi:hypothetical protein